MVSFDARKIKPYCKEEVVPAKCRGYLSTTGEKLTAALRDNNKLDGQGIAILLSNGWFENKPKAHLSVALCRFVPFCFAGTNKSTLRFRSKTDFPFDIFGDFKGLQTRW